MQGVDPSWEFHAPQYCDFSRLEEEEAQGVDTWFDSAENTAGWQLPSRSDHLTC